MIYITSQKMLACVVDITPQHLSDVIATRQHCSLQLAVKLEKKTGISTDQWFHTNTDRKQLRDKIKRFIQRQRAKQVEVYRNSIQ